MPRRPIDEPPKAKSRKPTREELLIWDYMTRQDRRLPHAEIDWSQVTEELVPIAAPPAAEPENVPLRASDDQLDSLIRKQNFTAAGQAHAEPKPSGGIDRNSARRLRQGKLPIEATLDLHGMYREEAHQQLAGFLHHAFESQKRCVLVITGKGKFHADNDGRGGGVLRRELPRWLAMPPIAAWVLRAETAQPHHGGEGAMYILLRRKR